MSDAQTQPAEVELTEAQALDAAQAGYDKKTRAEEAPVVVESKPEQIEDEHVDDEPVTETPPEPAPADALAEQLRSFKAEVQAMVAAGADRETVRKMHGEIGNINRTLQQLQSLKKDAPANDELAAALDKAKVVADEYPEIAGPLVAAMNALRAHQSQAATVQPTGETLPSEPEKFEPIDLAEIRRKAVENAAIKALDDAHPDRHVIKNTPEFKAWLSSKPPERQKTFWNTWSPAVLTRDLDEYKATLKARQRKQERLEGAMTPKGVATTAQSSTLPDDAGYARGYAKVRRL